MLLAINPDTPQPRLVARVAEVLKAGGVIAYPTDTTYGIGCSIFQKKGRPFASLRAPSECEGRSLRVTTELVRLLLRSGRLSEPRMNNPAAM